MARIGSWIPRTKQRIRREGRNLRKQTVSVVTGLKAELRFGTDRGLGRQLPVFVPLVSGCFKILLFSFSKLLKIYDIPPTLDF